MSQHIIHSKIEGFDEFAKQKFLNYITLVYVTDNNYHHIQQLEDVKQLLQHFGNDYYQTYHPNLIVAAKVASEIAEITRIAHYDKKMKENPLYIDNVMKEFPILGHYLEQQERRDLQIREGQEVLWHR